MEHNKRYIEELRKTESLLDQLAVETDEPIILAEKSILIVKRCLDKVRDQVLNNGFSNTEAEMHFFKTIKPRFVSRLIYHNKVYNIETHRPNGSVKIKRKYMQMELNKLKNFFDENLDFYRYYRTGSTYLDHKYFVRGKQDIRLNLDSHVYESDPGFCTSHDFKISSILAYDLLQVYLENELMKLDFKTNNKASDLIPKNMLRWTGSKIALVELMYALHTTGQFNNGQVDVKAIAAYFEKIFDIEFGNYYRMYLEMKVRQSPTKFLDSLAVSLERRIEEEEK